MWLVSYSADDDRELGSSEIAAAIKRGEIDGQTIVWTDGMPDWLPIASVPELAKLLPQGGDTAGGPDVVMGGFLGTGMAVGGGEGATKDRKSVKPPLPAKRSSRPPPPPADEEEESQPISVMPMSEDRQRSSSPPPPRRAPDPPKAPRPPRPPGAGIKIGDAEPSKSDEDEEIEPAPSSGTPALATLASLPPKLEQKIDESILALGGSNPPPLAPPTIDLSGIAGDAGQTKSPLGGSDRPPAAEKEDRTTTPPTSEGVATPFLPDTRVRPAAAAPKPPEERKGSPMPWIVALGACALAAWALVGKGGSTASELPAAEPPAPAAMPAEPAPITPPAEPAPTATASAPVEVASTTPTATATASATAVPTAVSPSTPAAVAEPTTPGPTPTPTAAVTATPTPTAAATEPGTAPTATAAPAAEPKPDEEVSMAGPFDKGAAAAALSAQAAVASTCRKEGDPSGRALVTVTFANSGRAVRATIEGPPFAGTATGGCIASAMRQASIPAYGGDRVTVTKTVVIN